MNGRTKEVTILVVDDEHENELVFSSDGRVVNDWVVNDCVVRASVVKAGSLSEAVKALEQNPDVIVLDVMFPKNPGDLGHEFSAGLFLKDLENYCRDKRISPPPVFLVSGQSEPAKRFSQVALWLDEGRIQDVLPKSMSDIGWDFFRAVLKRKITDCLARTEVEAVNRTLVKQTQALRTQLRIQSGAIGSSPAIRSIEQQIAKVAPTTTTVLIRGESGVGKELVARAMHNSSLRKNGPLVTVNCAALSDTLLESELFGHEKGAFTGAFERRKGKFEAADDGTLFLDEIGELPLPTQAKLLRVLEGHPFERVGGNTPIDANVRLVAATNRPIEEAVEAGTFRRDLFFRLKVVQLDVPALRDRLDDVPLIAQHFLERFAEEMGRRIREFTPAAIKKMTRYDWPGNVRELKNVVERAVVFCNNETIDVEDIVLPTQSARLPPPGAKDGTEIPDDYLADLKDDVEMWKELSEDYRTPLIGSVNRLIGSRASKQLKALDAALDSQTNPDPFHYYKAILYFYLASPNEARTLDYLRQVFPLSKPQATKVLKGLAGARDHSMGDCCVLGNPILEMTKDGAALEFKLRPGLA